MQTFTSSYLALKNSLDAKGIWAHLVELVVNANTTARFCSAPDTITWNGNTYLPAPMIIGVEEQTATNEIPRLTIDVANIKGSVYKFVKDNDLSKAQTTIRLVNTTLTQSGADARIVLKVIGSAFGSEVGRFLLGHGVSFEAQGPIRTYNRRDFPGIPYNVRNFFLI